MILNNIEVNILATIELIDAYNKNIPDDFLSINVIYCVHNKINDKNYIGQTMDFKNRFSDSYIGHFKDYNKFINGELNKKRILYNAWVKYGLESFVVYIIDTAENREGLDEKEVYWIKTLHTCTKDSECLGYNLTWGADDTGDDKEAIQRGIQTRIERYGSSWANCHTQEAYDKGNKTKIERYGHGGFINAFTPEANEKRKQTNLAKFGTTHGPKMSEEGLERMISKKIEKYGDKMGSCNTPENRKKALHNRAIYDCFLSIETVFQRTESEINNWKEFKEATWKRYKHVKKDYCKLINKIINLLQDLKTNQKWTEQYERIFGNLTEENKIDYQQSK